MFDNLLTEQNPHWSGEFYDDGIQRECFGKLLQYLDTKMIISIMGVRRAGKSTLLKQLINHLIHKEKVPASNILFLNLEHPYLSQYNDVKYLQRIFDEYVSLVNPEGKIYCLLDEVQYFSQWQVFLKAHFETKKIKFVITGSNSALLSSELMTLLSGRTLPLEVFPLSFKEIANFQKIDISTPVAVSKNRNKLKNLMKDFLHYGGFPEVVSHENKSIAFDILSAYAKSILYQDVAARLHLRQSMELEKLFVYLISNVAKPFSYHKLAELFALSDKSVKDYIKAFEDSYLLFELDLFSYSYKKQIRNPKKIFSIDMGQINAVSFKFSENSGKLLENCIYLELKRLGFELFYYKTKQDLEVDFIAKKGMQHALIQVAWSIDDKETKDREIKALKQACEEMHLDKAFLITLDEGEEMIDETGTIFVLPAYKFLCQGIDFFK